mmetsp:Transcript_10701/g.18033  ORF Transcript_10701/g.18033 Transcript_10701/m.18033 type:complete len:170 (-) Transcript_10701:51-560(-)
MVTSSSVTAAASSSAVSSASSLLLLLDRKLKTGENNASTFRPTHDAEDSSSSSTDNETAGGKLVDSTSPSRRGTGRGGCMGDMGADDEDVVGGGGGGGSSDSEDGDGGVDFVVEAVDAFDSKTLGVLVAAEEDGAGIGDFIEGVRTAELERSRLERGLFTDVMGVCGAA